MDEVHDIFYKDVELGKLYHKYRPNYSDDIYNKIVAFCKESGSDFDVAVDIGCGPGQSTIPLAKYFTQVIGVDVSEAQISNAPKDAPNVTFKVSSGEDLGFVLDGSVDLVTVATAFHYIDHPKFFKEMDRVLKPKGCIVVYTYRIPHLSNQKADTYFQNLMETEMYPLWTDKENTALDNYRSVQFPYANVQRDENLTMEVECTFNHFIGMFSSVTFVQALQEQHPDRNILEEMRAGFLKCADGQQGLDTTMTVKYVISMIMCCKS